MFSNLLNETKGFKYQITVKGLLKKYKLNGKIEFATVYFNSMSKKVINHRFRLENSFQEILRLIYVGISKGSGWVAESIKPQYINILTHQPLSGSSYMNLPVELRSPKKGLINIKNKDQKCLLWCHVRHINPPKENPKRIRKVDKKLVKHITNLEKNTEEDKELISYLDNKIEFPVQEKDFSKIEVKNNICINVFGYENELVFPIYVSDQKFEDSMYLLLLTGDDKSHYMYIKDFNRFIFHKTKHKNKKYFCKSCLHCFSSKNVLTEHKENCLSINGKQPVKVEEGTIEFENYFQQIPVPFKTYADFESDLESVKSYEGSYTKKYQDHVPCSFAYKVVCIDDYKVLLTKLFTKPIVLFRGENAVMDLIKQFLKSITTAKK